MSDIGDQSEAYKLGELVMLRDNLEQFWRGVRPLIRLCWVLVIQTQNNLFPFDDAIRIASFAGVEAIIQPGGFIRDGKLSPHAMNSAS